MGSRAVGAVFLAFSLRCGRSSPQSYSERFGVSPCEREPVKFEPYCDTGTGFAMTKVDMGCGA